MPTETREPLPAWLLQLRTLPELESEIRWYTDEEVHTLRGKIDKGDGHLKLYDRIAMQYEGNLGEDAAELLRRAIPVGVAVADGRFTARNQIIRMALNFPVEFWFDPTSPETLLCSLNSDCPPHFWFPVGKSLESITSALAVYFAARSQEPAEGPAEYASRLRATAAGQDVPPGWTTKRMLLGLIGDMRVIENGLVMRPAFCRSFDSLATADRSNRLVPVTSFRTVNSFSHVSLEYHRWLQYAIGDDETGSPVVVEMTYPPAGHADLIRRYNEALDVGFPLDAPVDVVAALFGYPTKDLARLHAAMTADDEPGNITYAMGFLAATEGDAAVLLARLREFSTHPEPNVRAKVARYASIRQHPELVHQMIAVEEDGELKEYLQGLVAPADPK